MSEYWKSNPRKFCTYCKCWIADNKPSVDFHERGKKHQENVQQKLQMIHKKGAEDFKKQKKYDSQMRAIEAAAHKAYAKDLANQQLSASGGQPEPAATTSEPSKIKIWHEARSPEGFIYYYNTFTSESKWEPPEEGYLSLVELKVMNKGTEMDEKDKPQSSGKSYLGKNQMPGKSGFNKSQFPGGNFGGKNQQFPGKQGFNSKNQTPSAFNKNQLKVQQKTKPKPEEKGEDDKEEVEEEAQSEGPLFMAPDEMALPIGEWEEVKQEAPQKYVDLELPAQYEPVISAMTVAEEPKFKFREKKVTSLLPDDDEEGGAPSEGFKKRKFNSGFKRNIRSKTDD